MKEGEVSILRKNIESVSCYLNVTFCPQLMSQSSQIHAAQIAQLKADKEQADAKRLQLQIEMEKKLEALRTDYKFKVSPLICLLLRYSLHVRNKN